MNIAETIVTLIEAAVRVAGCRVVYSPRREGYTESQQVLALWVIDGIEYNWRLAGFSEAP